MTREASLGHKPLRCRSELPELTFLIGDGRGFGEGIGWSSKLARLPNIAVVYGCETNTSKYCSDCRALLPIMYEGVSFTTTAIKNASGLGCIVWV